MNTLKNFTEVIQIEVSVNEIAEKLLAKVNQEEKHAVLITETVIGCLLQDKSMNQMSILYSALNGYTSEINFKVDEEVICSRKIYNYQPKEDVLTSENESENFKEVHVEVGICKIVKIDLYAKEKLTIEYDYCTSKGVISKRQMQVSHKECDKIEYALAH